jgi:hypothetical protein
VTASSGSPNPWLPSLYPFFSTLHSPTTALLLYHGPPFLHNRRDSRRTHLVPTPMRASAPTRKPMSSGPTQRRCRTAPSAERSAAARSSTRGCSAPRCSRTRSSSTRSSTCTASVAACWTHEGCSMECHAGTSSPGPPWYPLTLPRESPWRL